MPGKLTIQPLTPTLGAEISNIDIKKLDKPAFETLYKLWLEHKVLFFRGQDIDLEDLLGFSRRFGELMRLPYIKPHEG